MAVVSRDKNNQSDKEKEWAEVDLEMLASKDADLPEGTKTKLNASASDDAWDFAAPPPKGHYDLRLGFGKGGKNTTAGIRLNKKDTYYTIGFECRIVNHTEKDYNNIPVFAGVSTRIGRGKEISTAAALLVKMGVKLPDREISDLEVVQLWAQLIKRDPICRQCLLDWRGGYKEGDGDWQNVFSTMEDFPLLDDGTYNYEPRVTTLSGAQLPVRAQLYVSEWGASNVDKINHKKEVGLKGTGSKAVGAGAGMSKSNGPVGLVFQDTPDVPTFLNPSGTAPIKETEADKTNPDLQFMVD